VSTDHIVLAKIGRVTGRVCPGCIGEVVLPVRGGSEAFHAYAVEPDQIIEPGTRIVVIEFEEPRTVRVSPV
jgi:hypothetical protein